jgi:hypothetical protein
MNNPDLVIDPDNDDDNKELYGTLVRPTIKPCFIDVAQLANAWCENYPGVVDRISVNGKMNTKTLLKLKTMNMNTLCTPRHHHQTNASTLSYYDSYTLCPGITTQYLIGLGNNTLEVTMKKPSGNPRTRMDQHDLLMTPHLRHKVIHHPGDIFLEVFMSGCLNQEGLTKNKLEMKRTFQNVLATRNMLWTIW